MLALLHKSYHLIFTEIFRIILLFVIENKELKSTTMILKLSIMSLNLIFSFMYFKALLLDASTFMIVISF